MYYYTLQAILYAEEHGYIPVVDWQHVSNTFFKDDCDYKENPWEYYFEQPAGISLNELNYANKFIISNQGDFKYINFDLMSGNVNKCRANDKKSFNKIRFNKDITNYLEDSYKTLFNNSGEDVLGILYRGTDYIKNKPLKHAVQPSPDIVIQKARELLKIYNYKKNWIATEDLDAYKKFKIAFGDLLIENPQYMYSNEDVTQFLAYIHVNRENHHYLLGKEYIRSIYLLTKCKYIIGGRTNGITGAYFISRAFENQEYVCLFDYGTYGGKPYNFYYKHWAERFFSVRSECCENIRYKVVTLLGIKIKFKRFGKEFFRGAEYSKAAGTL